MPDAVIRTFSVDKDRDGSSIWSFVQPFIDMFRKAEKLMSGTLLFLEAILVFIYNTFAYHKFCDSFCENSFKYFAYNWQQGNWSIGCYLGRLATTDIHLVKKNKCFKI